MGGFVPSLLQCQAAAQGSGPIDKQQQSGRTSAFPNRVLPPTGFMTWGQAAASEDVHFCNIDKKDKPRCFLENGVIYFNDCQEMKDTNVSRVNKNSDPDRDNLTDDAICTLYPATNI